MHTFTAIAKSLGEVTAIALILGVGVPVVVAAGIRFWSMEPATVSGPPPRATLSQAVAYVCFAIATVVVALGILYVAKDFISHTFDLQLFGAKPPKK